MNFGKKLRYWFVVTVKRLMLGRSGMSEEDSQRKYERIKAITRATLRNVFIDRKGTYCPKLWNEAFIDQYGNVFNCCYSRPTVIGNLHQSDLNKIWAGSRRLKLARWLARHKALYCALNCDIVTETEKNWEGRPTPPIHPDTIRVLHGELCNVACTMCWQNHTDRHVISNDLLKERVNWAEVDSVELQGGEVLAMNQAKEFFLWVTRENHKKASLVTNGTLINKVWARNLVLGSEWIQVSVNAATQEVHERVNVRSKFSRVTGNIRNLVRLKQELGSPVKIIYKYTIIEDNLHEIAAAIPAAAELGCDKIVYGFDPSVPGYIHQNPELRADLRRQLREQLAQHHPIEIDCYRLQYLKLLEPADLHQLAVEHQPADIRQLAVELQPG
jgi:MoaA/NifB/PqqE/SkfB family radical SAM enzyme